MPLSKKNDGATCIKNICARDISTHRLLVKLQLTRTALARRGRVIPALDAQLVRLARSYNARQQKVRSSRLLRVQTFVSDDVRALMAKLKSWISGVGAVPLVVVVVPVALVAVAGLGYLVYNAFYRDEVQAQKDNDEAAHASAVYGSMNTEQQQFDDERAKTSYDTGFQAGQKDGGPFGGLKNNLLLIGGTILVLNYLSNRKQ